MHGIARDGLLNLGQQRLGIADKEIAHVFAALEFRLQQFDRAADHAALQLNKTSIEGHAAIHGREEPECSLAAYIRGLDCRAVLQNGEQRKDGALGEIGVLKEATRVADDVTKLEVDRFQMRFDPFVVGRLHRFEQLIVINIILMSFGHNDTVESFSLEKCPGREDRSRGFAAGRFGGPGAPNAMRLGSFPKEICIKLTTLEIESCGNPRCNRASKEAK